MNTNTVATQIVGSAPRFARGDIIRRADFESTRGRKAKLAWIALFNNCSVLESDRDYVLIHATDFAASGIARDGGFTVYSTARPSHFVVHTSRVGVRIIL